MHLYTYFTLHQNQTFTQARTIDINLYKNRTCITSILEDNRTSDRHLIDPLSNCVTFPQAVIPPAVPPLSFNLKPWILYRSLSLKHSQLTKFIFTNNTLYSNIFQYFFFNFQQIFKEMKRKERRMTPSYTHTCQSWCSSRWSLGYWRWHLSRIWSTCSCGRRGSGQVGAFPVRRNGRGWEMLLVCRRESEGKEGEWGRVREREGWGVVCNAIRWLFACLCEHIHA